MAEQQGFKVHIVDTDLILGKGSAVQLFSVRSREMPLLILRKYRGSEDVELPIENLEGLSVRELKENAASRLDIPLEELSEDCLIS